MRSTAFQVRGLRGRTVLGFIYRKRGIFIATPSTGGTANVSPNILAGFGSIGALLVCLSAANADQIAPCPAPRSAIVVPLVSKTPVALQKALHADIGDLAKPREDFNATDVITEGLLSKRLIFIWNQADFWIVATERGGLAYSDPILAYRLAGQRAALLETRSAVPNTVCATAKQLWSQHDH